MKKEKQSIDKLIKEFCIYLRSIHRGESTIRRYCQTWNKVKLFMSRHNISYYDQSVGDQFLTSLLGNVDYAQLTPSGKNIVNRVEALHEFQGSGTIAMGMRRKPARTFEGAIGVAMSNYIDHRQAVLELSPKTINSYCIYLHAMLVFLSNIGIDTLEKIRSSHLVLFISSLDSQKLAAKYLALGIMRNFFKHLYVQQLLAADYSQLLPDVKYRNQPHLPSVFSKEEIGTLLSSVDRANPKGKRDYAILLLAVKLGLRASDIAALKFENLLWHKSLIQLNQLKTGKLITLPLLAEVGNAIIEYLKYGRPVSEEDHCFLQVQSPYKRIHSQDIANLVCFHMKRAGINMTNRKHGPHALRHSFAGNLLLNQTLLPVISEALGHSHTQSTMQYLRIDINTLKQCALPVTLVPTSFYQQKGGLRHG
jgi:site-specific recombinase XerD